MERIRGLLEAGANLAIIVVAVVLVAFVGYRFLVPAAPPPQPKAEGIKPGEVIPPGDLVWDKSEKNLVLVLSTNCKYCHESAPFYQKLAEKKAGAGVRLVAVFSQPRVEAQAYLAEKGIVVDELVQINPASINVRGTPTLLLVDRIGVVKETWTGKLSAEKEAEALVAIFGTGKL